jgi:23S rRNA pseudouridine1911/1915/1917 synthase
VRPVTCEKLKGKEIAKDKGGFYRTEILSAEKIFSDSEENYHFTLRLRRGFRHQIRCHLAWKGFPVLNDPLYGKAQHINAEGFLALWATGLFFSDPASGRPVEYRFEQLTGLETQPNTM